VEQAQLHGGAVHLLQAQQAQQGSTVEAGQMQEPTGAARLQQQEQQAVDGGLEAAGQPRRPGSEEQKKLQAEQQEQRASPQHVPVEEEWQQAGREEAVPLSASTQQQSEAPMTAAPPSPHRGTSCLERAQVEVEAAPAPGPAAAEQPGPPACQRAVATPSDANNPPIAVSKPVSRSPPGKGKPKAAGGSASPGHERRQPEPPGKPDTGQRKQRPAGHPSEAGEQKRGRDAGRSGVVQWDGASKEAPPAGQRKRLAAQQQEPVRLGQQGPRHAAGGSAVAPKPFVIPKRTVGVEAANAAAAQATAEPAQKAKGGSFRIPKTTTDSSAPAPDAVAATARGAGIASAKRAREAADAPVDHLEKQRRGEGGGRVPAPAQPQRAPSAPPLKAGLQGVGDRLAPRDSFSDALLLHCSSTLVR
jgi:hypothetical protein